MVSLGLWSFDRRSLSLKSAIFRGLWSLLPSLLTELQTKKQEIPVPRWRLDHCAARTARATFWTIASVARGADVSTVACAGRPRSCRPAIARARVPT